MNATQRKESKTGRTKGNGAPRPTALVVIRCKISVARLIIGEKCLFSSAYLPFLASPSEPPSRDATQKTGRNSLDDSIRGLFAASCAQHLLMITNGLRRQRCAAAADSSTSGRINWRIVHIHPQNLFPSPESLGPSLTQCTALDGQKTRH